MSKTIYGKYGRKMFYVISAFIIFIFLGTSTAFKKDNDSLINGLVKIEFVKKIWDQAPHNAFTDLVFYKGYWYCTFREGASHYPKDGKGTIRIIRSKDAETWETVKIISDEHFDLRDSKFAITSKGKLMINYFCVPDSANKALESRVIISKDGLKWKKEHNLALPNEIIWRIKWQNGLAYTMSYQANGKVTLYKSKNGFNFEPVTTLPLKGNPNEAAIEFMPDGKMIAVIREEEKPDKYYFGESYPPYTNWKIIETPKAVAGPNVIRLPDNNLLATYRRSESGSGKLCLAKVENSRLMEIIDIKSAGDCGYAGMVWKDNALWISYYSTHEKKTSIYLAKVSFKVKDN